MSVKHVREYYNQITEQYNEMLQNIKDCEQDALTHVIDQDYIDKLKEQIKPIKDNYMTISWIMFLLNKPNRSKKEEAYIKRNKRLLSGLDDSKSPTSKIKENNRVLKSIKSLK